MDNKVTIKLEEILPKKRFDSSGDNSGNNLLIVGNTRCGKSYLAEAFLKQTAGEFLLITYDGFDSQFRLSSSQGIQKISGINSTTKPMVSQLILKSNLVIFDEIEFFLLEENSQDWIHLAKLALANENISTIIISQTPKSKVLAQLFPEEKITFAKMLVGKLSYSEVANSLIEKLPKLDLSYSKYLDYSSEKRHFLYYQSNKFQGIVSAN